MSRDAVASVYTMMLNDESFREAVATDPESLGAWELTDTERDVLLEEASTDVTGYSLGGGPVMGHLAGPSGPPLSGAVASGLGVALNKMGGLPLGSLRGPGIAADGGCCPWNKQFIADGSIFE